ncbi:MAG: ATPase P [Ruminococcaceae bacterium]|nr:ATPase P [Oscillospiraceae bacterium]
MSTLKTTLTIDGMMCSMCEAHICDVIRKTVPDAKKVAASHKKGEASFLTENAVDEEKLRAALNETGYACTLVTTAPYEKRWGLSTA